MDRVVVDGVSCEVAGGAVHLNADTGCVSVTYKLPSAHELCDLSVFQDEWAIGPSRQWDVLHLLVLKDNGDAGAASLELPQDRSGGLVKLIRKVLPRLKTSHRKSLSNAISIAGSSGAATAAAAASAAAPVEMDVTSAMAVDPSPAEDATAAKNNISLQSEDILEPKAPASHQPMVPPPPPPAVPLAASLPPATPKRMLTSCSSPIRVSAGAAAAKAPSTPLRRFHPLEIAGTSPAAAPAQRSQAKASSAHAAAMPQRAATAPQPQDQVFRGTTLVGESGSAAATATPPTVAAMPSDEFLLFEMTLGAQDHALRAIESLARSATRQVRALFKCGSELKTKHLLILVSFRFLFDFLLLKIN
jgi:hypothetical protein